MALNLSTLSTSQIYVLFSPTRGPKLDRESLLDLVQRVIHSYQQFLNYVQFL